MNLECGTCHRPLPDAPSECHIGGIRFCCRECVVEWRIAHNKRFRVVPVAFDRRATA